MLSKSDLWCKKNYLIYVFFEIVLKIFIFNKFFGLISPKHVELVIKFIFNFIFAASLYMPEVDYFELTWFVAIYPVGRFMGRNFYFFNMAIANYIIEPEPKYF